MPRNRIGSCCGKGKNNNGPAFNDLNSIAAIKLFLSLVDSGATVRQYQIKFGWSRDTLKYQMTKLNMLRRTYACSVKIEKLIQENKGGDMNEIRPEINRLRKLMWRDGPLDEV